MGIKLLVCGASFGAARREHLEEGLGKPRALASSAFGALYEVGPAALEEARFLKSFCCECGLDCLEIGPRERLGGQIVLEYSMIAPCFDPEDGIWWRRQIGKLRDAFAESGRKVKAAGFEGRSEGLAEAGEKLGWAIEQAGPGDAGASSWVLGKGGLFEPAGAGSVLALESGARLAFSRSLCGDAAELLSKLD